MYNLLDGASLQGFGKDLMREWEPVILREMAIESWPDMIAMHQGASRRVGVVDIADYAIGLEETG